MIKTAAQIFLLAARRVAVLPPAEVVQFSFSVKAKQQKPDEAFSFVSTPNIALPTPQSFYVISFPSKVSNYY